MSVVIASSVLSTSALVPPSNYSHLLSCRHSTEVVVPVAQGMPAPKNPLITLGEGLNNLGKPKDSNLGKPKNSK